jgi:hypothetical protein
VIHGGSVTDHHEDSVTVSTVGGSRWILLPVRDKLGIKIFAEIFFSKKSRGNFPILEYSCSFATARTTKYDYKVCSAATESQLSCRLPPRLIPF